MGMTLEGSPDYCVLLKLTNIRKPRIQLLVFHLFLQPHDSARGGVIGRDGHRSI